MTTIRKRAASLALAFCMLLSMMPILVVEAEASDYEERVIKSATAEVNTALSLIDKQTFNSPMTAAKAKTYVTHFVNSTSNSIRILLK